MLIQGRNRCIKCFKEIGENEQCSCGFSESQYEGAIHWLKPGTILDNRYFLGKVIGEGGFGITYVGFDVNLDIKVAIKEFFLSGISVRNTEYSDELEFFEDDSDSLFIKYREKFVDEARMLARFNTEEGIVTVHNFIRANNTAYIIMEYVEGQDLKNVIEAKGTLPTKEVVKKFLPLMQTLNKVHEKKLVHRDISPDNILVTPNGKLKLIDFGAARDVSDGNKSLSIVLKDGFAPPEQYASHGKQGPWTDVYAIASTMYKCMTGELPVPAMDRLAGEELTPLSQAAKDCSPEVSDVIMKGLALHIDKRYQSLGQMADDLEAALAGKKEEKAPVVPPVPPVPPVPQPVPPVPPVPPQEDPDDNKTEFAPVIKDFPPKPPVPRPVPQPAPQPAPQPVPQPAPQPVRPPVPQPVPQPVRPPVPQPVRPPVPPKPPVQKPDKKKSSAEAIIIAVLIAAILLCVAVGGYILYDMVGSQKTKPVHPTPGVTEKVKPGGEDPEVTPTEDPEVTPTEGPEATPTPAVDTKYAYIAEANVGDYIAFANSDWMVLKKESNYVTLISDQIVSQVPLNNSNSQCEWHNCSLNSWLNGDYYRTTFSDEEKEVIMDSTVDNASCKVYILSSDEAEQYFESDYRRAALTSGTSQKSSWWLRTVDGVPSNLPNGYIQDNNCYAEFVNEDGYLRGSVAVNRSDIGVRPVINIDVTNYITDGYVKDVPSYSRERQDFSALRSAQVGSMVEFGNYQGKNKWKVLSNSNNSLLLISEGFVAYRPFHEMTENVSWRYCDLRQWLNSEYYNEAFSKEEKDIMYYTDLGNSSTDSVYLLSESEVKKYFKNKNDRIVYSYDFQKVFPWWLRDPVAYYGNRLDAAIANAEGNIQGFGASESWGVRPVIQINLNAIQ